MCTLLKVIGYRMYLNNFVLKCVKYYVELYKYTERH